LEIDLNRVARLVEQMIAGDMAIRTESGIALTDTGRTTALHLIRAHRLWESYLAEKTGYRREEWHTLADAQEHTLSETTLQAISRDLGNPRFDPDGDPIPRGNTDARIGNEGRALTSIPEGERVQVVHVEDEPKEVYAQLTAIGIHPGVFVHVLERSNKCVRVWAQNDEHVLSPVVAANISVIPNRTEQSSPPMGQPASSGVSPDKDIVSEIRLSNVHEGSPAKVLKLSEACRGAERRRFLDLGIVPGTVITPEFRSPGGDPVAYRIRDSLVALREPQANMILVTPLPAHTIETNTKGATS
jgi:DtxR family Mn-dependent transcriptional regulator